MHKVDEMLASKKIALIVPSLAEGGAVSPAVARFVKDAILQSGQWGSL